MKIRPIFAWYDLWIGAFWDGGKRRLYMLPLPCLGVVIQFKEDKKLDVAEQLRLWIWEQIDKHGEDLIAVQPTFDLILNKIDEFRDE